MERLKDQFFGRRRLLQEITEGVLANQPASFSLVGTKYVGKSHILNHLLAPQGPLQGDEFAAWRPMRFQEPGSVIALLIDCDWHDAQQDLMSYLYQRLRSHIEIEERISLDWARVDSQSGNTRKIWQIARQLNQMDYRLIVLMDNFDRAFENQLIHLESSDELRPLTLELALIVATEQPLHDLDRELAASPLFNVMTQLFVGLLEIDAAERWLDAYCMRFPAVAEVKELLLTLTGTHPYLLRRIDDILEEIQQFMAPGQGLSQNYAELIRLRLAEHGRLLFVTLWQKLQKPPVRIPTGSVHRLLQEMSTDDSSAAQIEPNQFATLNWLINQAIVSFGDGSYHLFSPLFADFIATRQRSDALSPTPISIPGSSSAAPIYNRLTKTERALLSYFENHSGAVVPAQQLLSEVWHRPDASPRRVQEAIRRLRLQLEEANPPVGVIENERGLGYRFIPATVG